MKKGLLNSLYYSKANNCCKCGCNLSDANGELGKTFVLDKQGRFYCMNCDSIFEDGDERIYDADLYEDASDEEDICDYEEEEQ